MRLGQSVEELIPVNVPATKDYADLLDTRLRILEDYIEDEST